MVGADHGIICVEISRPPHPSRLMLWNPVTNKKRYSSAKTSKHITYDVCVYAFGFLEDSMDYRIVHVYKKNFEDTKMSWSLFHPTKKSWSKSMSFNSSVSTIDPHNIVDKGVVYWIGWGGQQLEDPLIMVITLDMNSNKFYETEVPSKAKAEYNVLTDIQGGVGFLTQTTVDIGTLVQLWRLNSYDEDNMMWEKMITVTGISIMYNPAFVINGDIFSVTEARTKFAYSGGSQRKNVIISKHEHDKDRPEDLMSQTWNINVAVKNVTLHCNSLFLGDDPVSKD
ncbi:hypothetical protein PIB30_070327 [Stylosanthes scabra]|uniref:F-box associated beta-propeller type 1 domain-containing protein n=1 Tax=Stylosanthes scabra TaxID=79078 RepID=A0ABU6RNF3_9FABA|nr:hypothetical protein [Stylosanthes scabra]